MAKKKNKFVSAFEQFGRSFLLPVSVLPGAGIIKVLVLHLVILIR